MLVSAIHHHESAIGIHTSPPSWIFLPRHPIHSRLSQSTKVKLPALYSQFSLTVYFTHGNGYVSMILSQFTSPSPSLTVSPSLFSMSVSPLLPCKECIDTTLPLEEDCLTQPQLVGSLYDHAKSYWQKVKMILTAYVEIQQPINQYFSHTFTMFYFVQNKTKLAKFL